MTPLHEAQIQDQFTRQARTFGAVPAHSAESSLQILAEAASVSASDRVLDVACGPGIVACDFAKRAAHVTGVDIVPAMLEAAAKRQRQAALDNVTWQLGSAEDLPFEDDSFSLVVTRYSFHHLVQPRRAFAEMVRVCRRGGRIVLSDVTPRPGQADAYDALEKLRDASHVHAMPFQELSAVADDSSCEWVNSSAFDLEMPLEAQLSASFTEHADRIREIVREDIGRNALGVNAEMRGDEIWYRIPVSVLVWRKP